MAGDCARDRKPVLHRLPGRKPAGPPIWLSGGFALGTVLYYPPVTAMQVIGIMRRKTSGYKRLPAAKNRPRVPNFG